MYNGPYLVLLSPVFLCPRRRTKTSTIKMSVAEMTSPNLHSHFDMAFGSLVLNCNSIYLGVSTRGSEKRISSAEELFGWLPPSTSLAVFIS